MIIFLFHVEIQLDNFLCSLPPLYLPALLHHWDFAGVSASLTAFVRAALVLVVTLIYMQPCAGLSMLHNKVVHNVIF